MLPQILLPVLVILTLGSCQSPTPINYSQKCGVSLVLEDTFNRRNRVFSSPTEDDDSLSKRRNYTAAEMHPWVVSFGSEDANKNWKHLCGGSIISSNYVLTAHHCVQNLGTNGMVRAGDSDLTTTDDDKGNVQISKVIEVNTHPYRDANSQSAFFDVVVLKVDPPFNFTSSVRKICLPTNNKIDADDREGEGVTVAGYGETSVGKLLSTMVTIRPESFCKRIYEADAVNKTRDRLQNKQDLKADEVKNAPIANNSNVVNSTDIRSVNIDSSVGDSNAFNSTGSTVGNSNVKNQTTKHPVVRREAPKKKATPEQQEKRFEAAVKIVPGSFNTSIMCIGSEIGGIGACEGDDGGPGYVFDTGNNLNEEKFVQLSVFHGSVECGLASFPDIYVRLEEPQTLDFIRKFVPKDANDFDDEKQ